MKIGNIKIIVAVVFATAILFFSHEQTTNPETQKLQLQKNEVRLEDPFDYKKMEEVIHGYPQVIHRLMVDPKDPRVDIIPVLSNDGIYGYETTTSMAVRKQAKAAVNGGFFYEYGQPSGLVIVDGKTIHSGLDRQAVPTLVIDDRRNAALMDLSTHLWAEIGSHIIDLDGVNREPEQDEVILFTPEYGKDTRTVEIETFNVVIQEETVQEVFHSEDAVDIPEQGTILTGTGESIKKLQQLSLSKGQAIKVHRTTKPVENIVHAYEGGFWVVKNGADVMRAEEKWIGLTTNREPRTVMGIEEPTGKVVFLVNDGRQPGYSMGFTGKELAEYLLEHHINNAVMLDGGASSTMVLDGKMVNRPSYRGEERLVGGALIVRFDK